MPWPLWKLHLPRVRSETTTSLHPSHSSFIAHPRCACPLLVLACLTITLNFHTTQYNSKRNHSVFREVSGTAWSCLQAWYEHSSTELRLVVSIKHLTLPHTLFDWNLCWNQLSAQERSMVCRQLDKTSDAKFVPPSERSKLTAFGIHTKSVTSALGQKCVESHISRTYVALEDIASLFHASRERGTRHSRSTPRVHSYLHTASM
mmetsp:Transcript_6997/g.19001  ORF Transcript_6997/g.19001 Transcript_6997/m.19001 type:complete len:204 (+) Transcript_6997:271-882(+)